MEIDLKLCNFAAEKASLLGACPQQGVGMKVKNKPWHSLNYTPNMSAISYKIAFTFTFDGNTLAISSKGNGKTYNQAYKVIINKVNLIKATGENGETLSLEKIK